MVHLVNLKNSITKLYTSLCLPLEIRPVAYQFPIQPGNDFVAEWRSSVKFANNSTGVDTRIPLISNRWIEAQITVTETQRKTRYLLFSLALSRELDHPRSCGSAREWVVYTHVTEIWVVLRAL